MTGHPEVQAIGVIVRGVVLSLIHTAPDEEVRARRIAIALREGILTELQAAEWLAADKARAA